VGLASDTKGNVYIADGQNYRIRKVTSFTRIICTFVGNNVLQLVALIYIPILSYVLHNKKESYHIYNQETEKKKEKAKNGICLVWLSRYIPFPAFNAG
jgi:hypothetical protein